MEEPCSCVRGRKRRLILKETPVYEKIYSFVRKIPSGRVTTYGQVAAIVGGCTPRMVGYAMAALPADSDVPWQRVINHQGKISPRSGGPGGLIQRELLTEEGVRFDGQGRVDLSIYAV